LERKWNCLRLRDGDYSAGDDYYRITTIAPKEVYDRYAETFENVLHSVQFTLLRANPDLFGPAK
jgi:hypothetical protein